METATEKKDENDDIPLSHVNSIMREPVTESRSNYIVHQLALQIENQNTFSGFVYDKLNPTFKNYYPQSLALTRLEFIRIWKYCILQRSFDMRLRLAGKPPPSYLFFEKPVSIPVPLAQLLKSLGSVKCPYTGYNVEIVPPALDEKELPLWAIYDKSIMDKWNKYMASISAYHDNYFPKIQNNHKLYGLFPDIDDCEGKSIGLTAKKVDLGGKISIRGASKIVKKCDLLIRICHDELFVNPVCSYNDMFMEFPDKFDAGVIRLEYLSYYYSYCRYS